MTEVETTKHEVADEGRELSAGFDQKNPLKRKRVEACLYTPNPEEKFVKATKFRDEIKNLVKLYNDMMNKEAFQGKLDDVGNSPTSLNGVIARLMEESDLPLSKLVNEIHEKLTCRNGNDDAITKATVKSVVLTIGQRICYGSSSADADILEDDSELALWCWETRDLKLFAKHERVSMKFHRDCRKKIHERIEVILAMINALEKSETHKKFQLELNKAQQKLNRVLNESDIRLLMENMPKTVGAEMSENGMERDQKLMIKQMEKNKRELDKERKKMDRELQKEKLLNEKELKRVQDEAREERRREKEEINMQKQLKRQKEEAEKDQKRKEKEEAELKKKLALQKQASIMERFLTRKRAGSSSLEGNSMKKTSICDSSSDLLGRSSESVTLAMDSVLAQNSQIDVEDMWRSHLNAWRSRRSNSKVHWGIRQKSKAEVVKELKLSTNKGPRCDDDSNMDKLLDGLVDSNICGSSSLMTNEHNTLPCTRKRIPVKQLLQFDKSNRPAFYGIWTKKSQVVGARHPLSKDPDIDYDIDSDEEWEEDEPGESLSDCDKDDKDEDESTEAHIGDEEDESEDGFFVPDGYLSENEGVKNDDEVEHDLFEEASNLPDSEAEVFLTMLRHQKYLNNLTEHALKKNQPLIITNLSHEKSTLLSADELTGTNKLERMCLEALAIRPFGGLVNIEASVHEFVVDDGQEASCSKQSPPPATVAAILDSDRPQIISVIRSYPQNIGKIVELLHNKFPACSKTQLRYKVREIAEFSENRWQVKKEVAGMVGLPISPEKTRAKTKSIVTFMKRCMPPTSNFLETSPQSAEKHATSIAHTEQQCSYEYQ